jgi:hypothetical protein
VTTSPGSPPPTPRLRRWATPALAVFGIALLVSALAHLQIFGVLGVLATHLPPPAPREPVAIHFEVADGPLPPVVPPSSVAAEAEPDVVAGDVPPAAAPPPVVLRERVRPQAPPPAPEPRREVARAAPPPVVAPPTPTAPPPPTSADRRQSITQRSDDPSVPPPPEARFLAEQSRRVEEETVAALRNHQEDAPEPTPGRARPSSDPDPGNAEENESADMRDREGHEERTATRAEAEEDRPREADTRPPPNVVARGNTAPEGPERSRTGDDEGSAVASAGRAPVAGGGEDREPEMVVIHDGLGTFRVPAASRAARGAGLGALGGIAVAGSGRGARGDGAAAGGTRGGGGRGRGMSAEGADLRVSWSTLEDVYGADELEREREAYVRERRSRAAGSNREQNWRDFRAAIENYVPGVRTGNQTALNAAASPFAAYLAEVHRRIHRQFADRFLPSLPVNLGELADRSLRTKLELIFNADGTMHRVGVIETSGYTPFDYGAFEAVMRGQPYPEAPEAIRSGDGRVYVRWAFYRSERQCGTFNAEPYILPHPPGTERRGPGTLIDRPEEGGVIPGGAPLAPETGEAPRAPSPGDGSDQAGAVHEHDAHVRNAPHSSPHHETRAGG